MSDIIKKLAGGDLRSDGKADEVAADVIRDPELLSVLLTGFRSEDKVIRMRAAHALEFVSRKNPRSVETFLAQIISLAKEDTSPEVRWHLAQIFGHINLTKQDRATVIVILSDYLKSDSILVKAWSIFALKALAERDESINDMVVDIVKQFKQDESAAVRNRAKQALSALGNKSKKPKASRHGKPSSSSP